LADTTVIFIEKIAHRFGTHNGMTVKEISSGFRYIRDIPSWQTKKIAIYLKELIHSEELYRNLVTIKNADHIIRKINELIPIICYITTRPNNIIPVTKKWLKKHNFPKAPIISRPDDLELNRRGKWKARVLEYLHPEVHSIIDDDPEILEYLSKDYPGTIYLYNVGKINSRNIKVIPCLTWDDIYREININHLDKLL